MASKRKNSLVNNINRRKRAGKSRPKSKSTVSKQAYRDMKQGWPGSRKKKTGAKRKATKRQGGRKAAKKK
jgi:hypothetical protein